MPHANVQLKIAAASTTIAHYKENLSPTLYDGFEEPASIPSDLRLDSMETIQAWMTKETPIPADRIILDLRALEPHFSRLVVSLGPIFYRWTGQTVIVILPDNENENPFLAAIADLLRSLELRARGIRLISCPTCARCKTNFPAMVRSIESRLAQVDKALDVAVMGCEVNGPGEAKAADIGIAFGDQKGMMFKHGEKIGVVSIEEAADVFLKEIEKL
jgi:hypothetical protein